MVLDSKSTTVNQACSLDMEIIINLDSLIFSLGILGNCKWSDWKSSFEYVRKVGLMTKTFSSLCFRTIFSEILNATGLVTRSPGRNDNRSDSSPSSSLSQIIRCDSKVDSFTHILSEMWKGSICIKPSAVFFLWGIMSTTSSLTSWVLSLALFGATLFLVVGIFEVFFLRYLGCDEVLPRFQILVAKSGLLFLFGLRRPVWLLPSVASTSVVLMVSWCFVSFLYLEFLKLNFFSESSPN